MLQATLLAYQRTQIKVSQKLTKETQNQVHHYLYTQGNLTDIDHVEILEYPQLLHVCESLHLHPASRFVSSPPTRLWLI